MRPNDFLSDAHAQAYVRWERALSRLSAASSADIETLRLREAEAEAWKACRALSPTIYTR